MLATELRYRRESQDLWPYHSPSVRPAKFYIPKITEAEKIESSHFDPDRSASGVYHPMPVHAPELGVHQLTPGKIGSICKLSTEKGPIKSRPDKQNTIQSRILKKSLRKITLAKVYIA
jgi:hypothetical protein